MRLGGLRRTALAGVACVALLGVAAPGAMASTTHPASTHPAGTHPAGTHPAGTHPAGTSAAALDPDEVSLSAMPAALNILAAPCGPRTVDIGVRNDSAAPGYADVLLEPDAPLTVSPDLISSYLPAGYQLVVPVRIAAPVGSAGGEYDVELEVGRTGGGNTLTVPVSVQPPPTGPGANLALGATITASSTHASFSACGAADGNANQDDWELVTGWNDGTPTVFPDSLETAFAQPESVGRVDVHTLGSTKYPTSRFGLKDWDVQVLDGGEWRTVASVRDNLTPVVSSTFDPVTATAVRVLAIASNDARYSRLVEVEIYAP